jgi:CRP-like cAMP-binding protein
MGADFHFLRQSELFKGLPDHLLEDIHRRGAIRSLGPGEVLFHEGDQGFSLFVIRGGVVEIQKAKPNDANPAVVAYLSAGECLGEMALITGRPRSATARIPQQAEVLEIPPEAYEELILSNNFFLRRLCELLAYRLESADTKLASSQAGKELRGSLQYFDIATVMQTLINSGQNGIMVIETPDKRRAEVVFAAGKILYAKIGPLEGEEAFYQIFQHDLTGEFIFRGEQVDPLTFEATIDKSPMNLLLEAMRMKDELLVFTTEIPDFERVFKTTRPTLDWSDEESLDTALLIWMKIIEGASLAQILADVPRCTYNTLAIIRQMLEEGLIR